MITIKRDGKTVCLKIDVQVPRYEERTLLFYWNCGDEIYAGLLAEHMSKELRALISDVRQMEYEKGYKDGRAKRKKKGYFYSVLKRIV